MSDSLLDRCAAAYEEKQLLSRIMIAAIIENIIILCVCAVIVIFAPGAWKWAGLACLLNINSFNINKGAK